MQETLPRTMPKSRDYANKPRRKPREQQLIAILIVITFFILTVGTRAVQTLIEKHERFMNVRIVSAVRTRFYFSTKGDLVFILQIFIHLRRNT